MREKIDDYIHKWNTHPDLPFLAWLMIALSKNFVASTKIKRRCANSEAARQQEFRDDGTTLVEKEVKE